MQYTYATSLHAVHLRNFVACSTPTQLRCMQSSVTQRNFVATSRRMITLFSRSFTTSHAISHGVKNYLKKRFDFHSDYSYNNHMDRFQAIHQIITALRRIDGRTSPWNADYTFNYDLADNVVDRELYVDEINQFPCVMCVTDSVQVRHIGAGQRYNILSFRIRGITWDEEVEDGGERLADDIEHVMAYVRREYPAFDEIRLDTIQTDEGLNAPLGAVIIEGTAVYRND